MDGQVRRARVRGLDIKRCCSPQRVCSKSASGSQQRWRRVGCAAISGEALRSLTGAGLEDAQIQDDWLEHLPLGAVKHQHVYANRHWLCYKRHMEESLGSTRRRFVFYARIELPFQTSAA